MRSFREFVQLEASGGIILFSTALLALVISNTFLQKQYYALFDVPLAVQFGTFKIVKPFLMWINDGFMTIFFLLVGLEIKREMIEGELNTLSKATLPAFAAIGGMAVPAFIYMIFNYGNPFTMSGWAIPTATDIAFSLGILTLLGSRLPPTLKTFLTALAIFDDIGAIVIIGIFYTKNISGILLMLALVFILILLLLNRLRVTSYSPYFVVGLLLWLCVLKSGVHATLVGIIIAFAIPIRDPKDHTRSPLRELEHKLHPWVAYGILPLFAFANAGISFAGITVGDIFGPVTLGIAAGLFIGKQIGVWSATMLAVRLKIARLPHMATGLGIYGISLVAGVGFTMSLFIGGLAFGHSPSGYAEQVRLGVIGGSLLAGLLGFLVLRWTYRNNHPIRRSGPA